MTSLVVQVLSICQLRKGNHSITDLGLVVPNYTTNFKPNYLLVNSVSVHNVGCMAPL